MKTGEIIHELITSDDYLEARIKHSEEVVNFIKEYFPRDYEYFREKEEAFQDLYALLRSFK